MATNQKWQDMIFDNIILDDLDDELTKEEVCQKHNK